MASSVCLGIDIGSTTVKVVVLDQDRTLLAWRYVRSNGRPRVVLNDTVLDLQHEVGWTQVAGVGLSGSGGGPIAELIGARHVNELVAQTHALGAFHREARTVIEIGGQDSKLLVVRWDEQSRQMMLEDFAMNMLCAAGTGAFLDQQAERLGVAIDGEFARLALSSASPARIAGRCTVFAKSDMIHLQQVGTPLPDILMGVCLALARNFTTVLGKGRRFEPPVLFQGGVAFNAAVARAFESVLRLPSGTVVVPRHHTIMAALGTAHVTMDALDRGESVRAFAGFDALVRAARAAPAERTSLPILARVEAPRAGLSDGRASMPPRDAVDAWLGVDVGSVSTNLVLIDKENRLLARRYLMTAGRPLEAVREGLRGLSDEVAGRVVVRGVGTTGSGRYLTSDFVGGDVVRNEITAQARAAVCIDPLVDTIIEIGGQDAKFISLDRGAVVDFAMNNACAAGTGSFLQEQGDRLKIRIEREFSDLAFSARAPVALGERCTVFMESDLVHHQQQGARVPDLTAGLAYSIAENYLNRVVNGRVLGSRVFFQGGVAANASVVAAFREITKRRIEVPLNHDVTGAIGVAILAREEAEARGGRDAQVAGTKFRGFDLAQRTYASEMFECRACPNLCQVHKVTIADEAPFFYGARCERFEEAGRGVHASWQGIPDLFAEREQLLLRGWVDAGPVPRRAAGAARRLRVGIPRNLTFFDFFPFWRAFLDALDCDVVLSRPTNPATVKATQERAAAESCFPVKLAWGHVADVAQLGVDVLLLPSLMTRENAAAGQRHNHYCPLIPATPHLLTANMPAEAEQVRVVNIALHLANARAGRHELTELARRLTGAPPAAARRAIRAGWTAMSSFTEAVRARGQAALAALQPGDPAAVVVGRSYTTNDLGASLDLPYKLRRMGVLPIPMDFLPLDSVRLPSLHNDMYWRSGQDILRSAMLVRDDPRLQAVYLTNFNCGPDAFLITFFRELMRGKPFLQLEVDDHSADAGVLTRCEAFFDSLNLRRVA